MSSETILLVDDDKDLTFLVQKYLEDAGYTVDVEHNGERAVERIVEEQPRAVVLDILMPEADGLSVCRQVRDHYAGPIVMMTALADDIDRVAGLEIGADMYLAKPVKPRVLLAHIRACLRRNERLDKVQVSDESCTVQHGDLCLDLNRRTVSYQAQQISVTSAEFDLLHCLARYPGKIVSRDALYQELFNMEYDGVDRNVDLRISRLRKKLCGDVDSSHVIKTIRGTGYLLTS